MTGRCQTRTGTEGASGGHERHCKAVAEEIGWDENDAEMDGGWIKGRQGHS